MSADRPVSRRLPDFPWDALAEHKQRALAHPDGIVDLSIGAPVDATPAIARAALDASSDWPGYPTTIGTTAVRQAALDWMARRLGVDGLGLDSVLPVTGTKELIADLALHLGLGAGDLVVVPALAYPTYEVGAALVGAEALASDSLTAIGPRTPALLWVNSPSNPTGKILPVEHLRKVVQWCRERGTVLVSDECYIEMAWDETPVSVLHPSVCDGDPTGILAVHSMSKRSNLAGYRCGFVAGDPALVAELLAVRKNLGLQMPGPQQDVMTAVLGDDRHVQEQRERYLARRELLRNALGTAGFRIEESQGSLYLWATRDEPCSDSVAWLAERGILVAPGSIYGRAGDRHVRVSLTATDERVATAVTRLLG